MGLVDDAAPARDHQADLGVRHRQTGRTGLLQGARGRQICGERCRLGEPPRLLQQHPVRLRVVPDELGRYGGARHDHRAQRGQIGFPEPRGTGERREHGGDREDAGDPVRHEVGQALLGVEGAAYDDDAAAGQGAQCEGVEPADVEERGEGQVHVAGTGVDHGVDVHRVPPQIDDAAPGRDQLAPGCLHGEQIALDVDGEDFVERRCQLLAGQPGETAVVVPDPGVGNQDVELPEPLDGSGDRRVQVLRRAYVTGDGEHPVRVPSRGLDQGRQLLGVLVEHRDAGAFGEIPQCHGAPEAMRRHR